MSGTFIDELMRYGTIALLVLALSWLVPLARSNRVAALGAVSITAMLAQLVASISTDGVAVGNAVLVAEIVAIPLLAANWLFARGILEDDFRLNLVDWAVVMILCAIKGVWLLDRFGLDIPARGTWYVATYVAGISVFAHIALLAIRGFADDLVKSRRTLRVYLVLALGIGGIMSLTVETIGLSTDDESLVRNALTFVIAFMAIRGFAELDVARLFSQSHSARKSASATGAEFSDKISELERLMDREELYTQHGLTIPKLASYLGMPEHRLRVLINRQLGFRNFPAFLNRYRIDYAKRALTDPRSADLPILTIAIDAGYTTLTTFNRAFKAATGVTPSEFRAANSNPNDAMQSASPP